MRLFLLICATLSSFAQQSSDKVAQDLTSEIKSNATLHNNILHLLELDGTRQRMQDAVTQIIPASKKVVAAACANCDPAFADEWAKRMIARTKIDDYVAVVASTYEKYLNNEDVLELIDVIGHAKETPPLSISPRLREKLTTLGPSLQSEIMGGTTQIGAKLGGEIELELRKEHPEYFKVNSDQQKK
jgi:hypothetical protein